MIERLRVFGRMGDKYVREICHEAADEIESLRQQVATQQVHLDRGKEQEAYLNQKLAECRAALARSQKVVALYEQLEPPLGAVLDAGRKAFLVDNNYELKYLPIYADQPDPTYIVKWVWEVRDSFGASVDKAHEWLYQAIDNAIVSALEGQRK